jgi:hypothetical protein
MKLKLKLLTYVLLFSSASLTHAQSIEEIQSSDEYIWGTGNAPTLKKADNEALAALISQISTNVSSQFSQLTEGGTENGDVKLDESFKSVINTYSRATLNNTRRIVIQNEPEAAVMRYIKVSEINKIFEGRKVKILDFVHEASAAEKKSQVADALRYYYWALILLQSYPDGNYLTAKDDNGEEQLLCNWIPKQMNDIFSRLQATIESVSTEDNVKTVDFKVTYKGEPARNYDYTYFDGRDWSNIYSAKDGLGIIELPAISSAKGLRIRTEYMFEGESNIDNELAEVIQSVNPISMKACNLTLTGDESGSKQETLTASSSEAKQTESALNYLSGDDTKVYSQTMSVIESAIRTKNFDAVKDVCTEEGLNMFNSLIKYGNGKIVKEPNFQYVECNGEVSCRSIPMSFTFSGNNRTFVEDIVVNMNKEGKVEAISFGLNKAAVDDIVTQTSWGEDVRKVLINFLESYKTAYALKRYDYINSIFSDDALIITGSVLKRTTANENQPMSKQAIKYTRQTKAEFMKRLKHIFAGNEYINLRFADNQIRKSGVGGEIYGIQIKQDYFSSSYGDTGYLFLMVDLNNPKEPIIHVRTWQPEKDPDFGVIDLSHF